MSEILLSQDDLYEKIFFIALDVCINRLPNIFLSIPTEECLLLLNIVSCNEILARHHLQLNFKPFAGWNHSSRACACIYGVGWVLSPSFLNLIVSQYDFLYSQHRSNSKWNTRPRNIEVVITIEIPSICIWCKLIDKKKEIRQSFS